MTSSGIHPTAEVSLTPTSPRLGPDVRRMSGWTRGASVSLPAIPDSVRAIRGLVTDLARRAGADDEQLEAVRLAVSEAATNVVMHAYAAERRGLIHLSASAASDELTVLVADDGHGHRIPTDSPGLGWGWKLIADSCDRLTILERGTGGTELRMQWRIRRDDGWDAGPWRDPAPRRAQDERESLLSAATPASRRFSTTT